MGLVVVPEDHVVYSFSPEAKPAARARPGDLVIFYTRDALGGQISSEEQTVASIDFSRVNPATGPLYVEGAEPGDALAIKVLSIDTAERGFVVTAPGAGALPRAVGEARTRACYVRGGFVEFLGLRLPARKMVGVIGVATREGLPTGVPGRHGGNLDTRFVTEGATVVLPVEYPGALLALGDLHATMGDGEVCVAACEVPGKVTVEVRLLRGLAPPWPVVQYGDSLYVLVSHEGLEEAVEEAVRVGVEALSAGLGLQWLDAYLLASLALDVGISQVVDPRKTVWVRIPLSIMSLEALLKSLRRAGRAR